jgi:hypothetical protein
VGASTSRQEKEERGGGSGTVVGSLGWLPTAPDHRERATPLPRTEEGGERGDAGDGVSATDGRDRDEAGPGGSGRGAREKRERGRDRASVGC